MLENVEVRVAIFFIVLILMALIEALYPKRVRNQARRKRWLTNFSLALISSVLLRLSGPVTVYVAANYALNNGWGLFNSLNSSIISLPFFLSVLLGIAMLDFAIYIQHIATHKIAVLWRFHKVHHADRDIDVTTGIRFHPIEIILSMLYKCVVILILGPPVLAVIIFEILLNASAMFNHANIKLPASLDYVLRLFIITPDVHRVHHSSIEKETNSNYGFCLSIWDRLFKTYTAQPQEGHVNMTIGLSDYQTEQPASLLWSIIIPFKNKQKM